MKSEKYIINTLKIISNKLDYIIPKLRLKNSDYLKYKNFYREHREEMENKKSAKDIRKYRSWIGESEGKER